MRRHVSQGVVVIPIRLIAAPVARVRRILSAGGLIAGLGACSHPIQPVCAAGMGAPMAEFTLYLGEAIPRRGDITGKEWQSFLDDTVTANLPNGYMILDANSAWMNPVSRKTIKQATKVVVATLPDTSESLAAVNRIRLNYQIRFHQQLVGMTVKQTCGSF
jgi:hypothetical protein